ncbi:acid protease [Massarina eburnea CBS 473.64]|uniref:Acid protease n=1 Tax=Massarina eburnea CBS 473.64 TaxID=1395130 RepID=A0A6A6S8X0_9PLEO|nr:acid protease [Massarina eburnea CBS 473.64]
MVSGRWEQLLLRLLLSFLYVAICETQSVGKALNIPASQYWDGKDGPWSTFRISVGTPSQQLRILPASGQSSSWLVLPEICTNNQTAEDCATDHGGLYMRNTSSTWDQYGNYELYTYLEGRAGLTGPGLYGWDKLGLGWNGDNLPSLDNQSIAGFITDAFSVGALALDPRPINFTDQNNPIPSLMQNLRNQSEPIPSISWSYTAGSYNLSPKRFGSLVLGGYDKSRFEANSVSFPFGDDVSLIFQVAIQDITANSTDGSLLGSGIISYISTLVADIWLPISACEKFETAFGLTWDSTKELYLLDDETHQSLLSKNPQVSFKVGPQASGSSVTINMPYWNFYHTATSALTGNGTSLYFPLKRAANDSQYILGRSFLQSAHLSADYERSVFNLSQALYPSSSSNADIIAVLSPTQQTSLGNSSSSNNGNDSSGLSTAAKGGIAAGVIILVVAAIACIILFLYRRKKGGPIKQELEDTDVQQSTPHEIAGDGIKYEMGNGLLHEAEGDMNPKAELGTGAEKPAEADGADRKVYEMPTNEHKYEMPGDERGVAELPGDKETRRAELPGESSYDYKP